MATRTISLFAGGGGLDLGLRLAEHDARTVCYVERDAQAVSFLVEKMRQGCLDDAPVWSDVSTFNGKPWRGAVDCIIGGFPCQPSSAAGKREGTNDSRWLWPHIRRLIQEIVPPTVFLENVRGLLSVNQGKAFGGLLQDLADMGYDATWGVVRASDAGAPHQRARIFIMANRNSE